MNPLDWLTERPIAHRGYHDGNRERYENSLSAFQAAVEQGFAIECDVQPTADGDVVVFHDATLDRLTAEHGSVRDRTAEALRQITLGRTGDRIPTLAKALDLIAGAVPVVVEMKGPAEPGYAEAVLAAAKRYSGPIALMSFDHDLVRAVLGHGVAFGLTAEGTDAAALQEHRWISPNVDFLSYGVDDLPNPFVEAFRRSRRPVITWTVRTPEQRAATERYADQMTFEGFDPNATVRQ